MLRLALPVTIFLMIVGFSFWADSEKRVDIALTMTLVVAALYLGDTTIHTYVPCIHTFTVPWCPAIVIGQVIPFVGYFTAMDTFVTMAFAMLSGVVAVHFLMKILDDTKEAYPLNEFFSILMMLVGR